MKYKLNGAWGWTYSITEQNGDHYWELRHEETGLSALLGDLALVVTRPSEGGKIILSEDVRELPFATMCTILNNVARDEKDYIKAKNNKN